MLMRWMPAARCNGASATISCMVEQLGLAMMPRGRCFAASGLTSLTTSGTSASWRKAEELSITTAPAAANFGAYSFETAPPAENSAMSTPAGSKLARSWTSTSSSPKATYPPADRSLASATISPTGNPRSASTDSITSPTAPVAPTTATLYCLLIDSSCRCTAVVLAGAAEAAPAGSCPAGDPRRQLAHHPHPRPVAHGRGPHNTRQPRPADRRGADAPARGGGEGVERSEGG